MDSFTFSIPKFSYVESHENKMGFCEAVTWATAEETNMATELHTRTFRRIVSWMTLSGATLN
jgi:hypothetical protein